MIISGGNGLPGLQSVAKGEDGFERINIDKKTGDPKMFRELYIDPIINFLLNNEDYLIDNQEYKSFIQMYKHSSDYIKEYFKKDYKLIQKICELEEKYKNNFSFNLIKDHINGILEEKNLSKETGNYNIFDDDQIYEACIKGINQLIYDLKSTIKTNIVSIVDGEINIFKKRFLNPIKILLQEIKDGKKEHFANSTKYVSFINAYNKLSDDVKNDKGIKKSYINIQKIFFCEKIANNLKYVKNKDDEYFGKIKDYVKGLLELDPKFNFLVLKDIKNYHVLKSITQELKITH